MIVGDTYDVGSPARQSDTVYRLGTVTDSQLRWLYASCDGLIAASYEDFGLTPVEAHAHGKPVLALRHGGYLETVIEGVNGIFFDEVRASSIAARLSEFRRLKFDSDAVKETAQRFSLDHFITSLRSIVLEEPLCRAPSSQV